MVRFYACIIFVLFSLREGAAQSLSFGMKISAGLGSSFKTGAPRDYYMLQSERYHIRTSGAGYLKINSFMPPEFFIRYQSKNRIFIQAGSSFIAARILTYYGLDPAIEDIYNPNRQDQEGVVGGIIPKDYIATRSFYFTPYVNVNYFLTKGTIIKPFVSLGISPTFLQSLDYMSGVGSNGTFINENAVMFKDFGTKSNVYINGRASLGLQFYDLHMEFHVLSNINSIDSTPDSYTKRITTYYLSLGYNFLTFNLAKKKRS